VFYDVFAMGTSSLFHVNYIYKVFVWFLARLLRLFMSDDGPADGLKLVTYKM
jgi:hypothetical protein